MTRREALIGTIEALHDEIAALKARDLSALEAATRAKLAAIDGAAHEDGAPPSDEERALAAEAHRLNETCRIYVNLMAANVRRRLQLLAGDAMPAYRPVPRAFA